MYIYIYNECVCVCLHICEYLFLLVDKFMWVDKSLLSFQILFVRRSRTHRTVPISAALADNATWLELQERGPCARASSVDC